MGQYRKAFQEWQLEQVEDHHMKGLYAFVREPSRALQRSRIQGQKVVVDPMGMAELRRQEWQGWWCRDAANLGDTLGDVDMLKKMTS